MGYTVIVDGTNTANHFTTNHKPRAQNNIKPGLNKNLYIKWGTRYCFVILCFTILNIK